MTTATINNVKRYRPETITVVRELLESRLQQVGEIKSMEIVVFLSSKIFTTSSTIRNIFKYIMDQACNDGYAEFICNGRWMIQKPIPHKLELPKPPPVISPQLYKFLNPPKEHPEIEIYEKIKDIKDQNQFVWKATCLCEEAGISIQTLVNYMYEHRRSTRGGDVSPS